MGCDVHAYLETKHKGKWVFERELDNDTTCRSYQWFWLIAGVRYGYGEARPQAGFPSDASESVSMFCENWGSDGHSHSHMPADEWLRMAKNYFGSNPYSYTINGKVFDGDSSCCKYLDIFEDTVSDYRVVFWFDN